MFLRRFALSVIFPTLFLLSANAQTVKDSVYLYLPATGSGKEGQTINIPVRVRGFNNVISAQFIVQWDSTKIQYLGVDGFGVASINEQSHFGYIGTNPDRIRFVWFDPDLKPQPIADDGILFNIRMKVIGKKEESSPIAFMQDGTTIYEFLDKDGNEIKYAFGNGEIKITGSTSASFQQNDSLSSGGLFPNPFSDEAFIMLNLTENQCIKLDIFDVSGLIVYSNSTNYQSGTQFVHINKNYIPSDGLYFYRISNEKGASISGKLVNRQ